VARNQVGISEKCQDLAGDLRQKIERLLAQLQDVSEQEALAQVYLRRRLFLCVPCCRRWIEHPVT